MRWSLVYIMCPLSISLSFNLRFCAEINLSGQNHYAVTFQASNVQIVSLNMENLEH